MDQVGIRELKASMSAIVRRVRGGEVIEVTEHGHPVMRLVPAIPQEGLERLIADGLIDLPVEEGSPLDIEPTPPASGVPLPSAILAALRANER